MCINMKIFFPIITPLSAIFGRRMPNFKDCYIFLIIKLK